jgi:DNA polymerase III epsilon subunit-like protein
MIDAETRIMMLDTETTNSLEDPICYDVGYRVFDLAGNVYEEASMVNADIFLDKDFMASAYYADKIPNYWRDIWEKKRELLAWRVIKARIWEAIERNGVKIVAAHNARFDYRSIHLTQRYITTSRWRYVLPWGCEWWDTLRMCREVFKDDENYRPWCEERGYITANNQPRMTAEVVYRYITGDENFTESHTGLEDVKIETEIFKYCLDKIPDIDGRAFPPKDKT